MTIFSSITKLIFLLCLLFSAGVQADTTWQEQSSRHLENLLQSNPEQLPELDEPAIREFYKERKYQPLWSDANGPLQRAFELLHAIIHARHEGLKPSDYYLEKIRKNWALNASIQLDLLLSAALYRYSHHVYSGRFNPLELDIDWHIEKKTLNAGNLFSFVASNQSIAELLDELPPQHSGYQLLKKELRRLRGLEHQGGWQNFEAGPILQLGVQHSQIVQLRQRLEISGEKAEAVLPAIDIFNHGLAEEVERYQQSRGLAVDGKVGPQTRETLNSTVIERIRQIRINMERWRWMPRKLGKRYLMVNMTGFELYIVDNGSTVLNMPVIVGKSFRSTPSFSGLVSLMEYNPYWTIPTNLAINDIIPQQIKNPSYFANKTIKLFRGWGDNVREIDPQTVDWSQLDEEHFPYWLRQEPGPKNSLGRIKFLFSNPHEIYLHGTPDIYLFDRVVRAFSSGCIRVKDPVQLASYLLNDGSQEKEEEILANIHLATNQSVVLPVAVPIYLVYWTAWVDPDGRLNFRDDIYGRDASLNGFFDD